MKTEFGVDAELVEGDSGIFDVVSDGKLLFSKHAMHRFPEHEEVLAQLR